MGTENLAKRIDLVVMTGSVPFIAAGIFQEDQTDATLISGALSGMSTMFQELLQQGELRHSELYNAHIYIRYLTQMNDTLGLVSPEIIYGSNMRVALIVREGELTREQELALSELCYSIMVKISERTNLAKKLVKGNIEGYIPTNQETIEILAEAINDYRRRAKKSIFYEKVNFLQEKDRIITLSFNDDLFENQIKDFIRWIEENYYPEFFPKFAFCQFFGKEEFWGAIQQHKGFFKERLKDSNFREQVASALFQHILRAGLMPLILYSGDIAKRIDFFYEEELPDVINNFLHNLLLTRGPVGISLRGMQESLTTLKLDDEKKIGWHFIYYFIKEIGNRPFEVSYLKQLCKLLEQFDIVTDFLSAIYNSNLMVVPKNYLDEFITIVNAFLTKKIDVTNLEKSHVPPPKVASHAKKTKAPQIPSALVQSERKKSKEKCVEKIDEKFISFQLPKETSESSLALNQFLINAISSTFSWVHTYLFGHISVIKRNIPNLSNEGLFFSNISESLTIEMGIIFELIQSFSGPRTWLIGQLERSIDILEEKLRKFESETNNWLFELEKRSIFDVQHVNEQFRKISERIIMIITQIENDGIKEKINSENKKAYLEAGFLGRLQENSLPQARKLLDELKSLNKAISLTELDSISKATSVNFKGLTTNITSLQLLAIPMPDKESDYSKETRDIFLRFKKWGLDLDQAIETVFRVGYEIIDPLKLKIHEEELEVFLRSNLQKNVNTQLAKLVNSDLERKNLLISSFLFKKELFSLIGERLLHNKPLNLFTTIPLSKFEDETNYIFSFTPIIPPIISDEITKFFVVSDEQEPVLLGRIYSYKPFKGEEIHNLSELIISDAFRRAFGSVEPGLTKILKIGKKLHNGSPNLLTLLMETYYDVCNKLSIIKTTN